MKNTTPVIIGLALSSLMVTAMADDSKTSKLHCMFTGTHPMETLGDRADHSISVNQYTCNVEGGPLDGAVTTGTTVYEWDGPNGTGQVGYGIDRKPGANAIYVNTEMKNTVSMTDGKVTGAVFSGRGRYAVATGAAASLAGKSYTYKGKTTGPNSFIVESTLD
jgi:hypothetical protein